MKFLVVLAAFLAVSSAASLFRGKSFYKNWENQDDLIHDKQFVRDEGVYGKYHGLGWLYGQQHQGLGYNKYAPRFEGRQNVYDYYGNKDYFGTHDYYGNDDYFYGNKDHFYGNKDLYYGNKDHFYGNMDHYYGNQDQFYGNKDHFYGNKDLYYGNKDYSYDNMDTTRYFNPFWNHVAHQGLFHQYENIVPYNFEYYNQIPTMYQQMHKGYYPLQHSFEHGYGHGLQYPSMYQNEYTHHYEPTVARQLAY